MNTSDYAKELGKLGGNKTKEKYGKEYYRKIIQKRWAKRSKAPKASPKTSA